MAGELRPGPASLAGLEWLVQVGPVPMEAWAAAMGWGERVARSHARRLERAGWLKRHRMLRGDGSLLVATRRGVRMTGLAVSAPAAPKPTWWAHDCACAWTAAWLTVRGATEWQGPREVLADPRLKRSVYWSSTGGPRRAGHRPDLTVRAGAGLIPVEVELERKSVARMHAILTMYRGWIADGEIGGVVYLCGSQARADRVSELAAEVGIPPERLRIELLSTVREQARNGQGRSAAGSASASGA
jgi:hypothetical protein